MNTSVPQSNESNLFEFHFTTPLIQTQQHEEPPVSIFHQQQPSFHALSYFAETTPNAALQENNGYSSPQLRPQHMVGFQRKRFKTVASSNYQDQQSSPSCNTNEDENDDEDEDDDSGDETDSNNGSVESGKKRGKYKIYSEEEKAKILNFMMKHGIQKTLEIFSSNTHKITKRKLKSWMESQHKVKGVKGRKTNDPNRDHALYDWCIAFQRDCGRAPTRKEATKKALELSADSSFQASKGWLDKFSKKFNYEFTPLKIIPPKKKKGDGFIDSDSGSTLSNSNNSSDYEGMSPIFMQQNAMQPSQSAGKGNVKAKPWGFENQMITNDIPNEQDLSGLKVSNFFNFSAKNNGMEMLNNYEKKEIMPSIETNGYQQTLNNGLGNNMAFGLGNGINNTMNNGMNNNMGYGFGYPLNYSTNHQMNFPMNHQPNHQPNPQLIAEENYPGNFALNNNHFYSDINGYLNTGGNYDNHGHHFNHNMNHNHHGHHNHHYTNNSDMKLEHPY